MRLVVCVEERDYLDWLRVSGDVLRSIAAIDVADRHLLIRVGSLIDHGGDLASVWSTPAGDDRAAVLEPLKQGRLAAYQLDGVPVVAVPAFIDRLRRIDGFVGYVDVTRDARTCLLLQSTLPLEYRIVGPEARVLHIHEGLVGDMDVVEEERTRLEALGVFEDVRLENIGVRDTIFDSGANDVHRALRVNEIVALSTDPERAEAVVLWLDVVDFRLTDALHAAAKVCSSATYAEEAAQGALSCRRFLEQLADALFPPRAEPRPAGRPW